MILVYTGKSFCGNNNNGWVSMVSASLVLLYKYFWLVYFEPYVALIFFYKILNRLKNPRIKYYQLIHRIQGPGHKNHINLFIKKILFGSFRGAARVKYINRLSSSNKYAPNPICR